MKKFQDIKGQNAGIEQLKKDISAKKVKHAYLFLGPSGIGKKTIAKAFASALFCKGEDIFRCKECANCKKFKNNNYPDFYLLEPDEKNAIRIEDIREIQKQLSLKNVEGEYRIILIDEAEKMTDEAANCLLKSLEEPPKGTIFILVAESLAGLLPTIVSRCQRINFSKLNNQEIMEILDSEYGISAQEASVLSGLAGGSVGKVIELKEKVSEAGEWLSASYLLGAIRSENKAEVLLSLKELEKASYLEELFAYWICLFRDLLVSQIDERINKIGIIDIENFQQKDFLLEGIDIINEGIIRLKKRANPRLVLDAMFLKLMGALDNKSGR